MRAMSVGIVLSLAAAWSLEGGCAWAQEAPEKPSGARAEGRDPPPGQAVRQGDGQRELRGEASQRRRDEQPAQVQRPGEGAAERRQQEQKLRRGGPPEGLREEGPPRPPPPPPPPGRGRGERRDGEGPPREAGPGPAGDRPGNRPDGPEGPPGMPRGGRPPGNARGFFGGAGGDIINEGGFGSPAHFGPGMSPGGLGLGGHEFLDDPVMQELIERDQQLDRQTWELAAEVRRQPPQASEAIKRQLAQLVREHFEVRQKRREAQLERMAEALERLRAAIQRRNELRDAIVEQRMRELLGEPLDF